MHHCETGFSVFQFFLYLITFATFTVIFLNTWTDQKNSVTTECAKRSAELPSPHFPSSECSLNNTPVKHRFWSMEAAKPQTPAPARNGSEMQPAAHGTDFRGQIWLAESEVPQNFTLCTCYKFKRCFKSLAPTDLQYYLFFLCSHSSAGTRVLRAAVPSAEPCRRPPITQIQLLANLHHRESFLPVFAPPLRTYHPQQLLEGAGLAQQCPKPGTALLAPFPQRWGAAAGPELLLASRDTAACPPSSREGGRSKLSPAKAWRYLCCSWQHPNAAMAAPQHRYGSPGNAGAEWQPSPPRSLLSVLCSREVQFRLLCYPPSSSSSWSSTARSLAPVFPSLPTQGPRTKRRIQTWHPQPRAEGIRSWPHSKRSSIFESWLGFFSYLQQAHSACAQHGPGWCPLGQGCCSPCPFLCLGSLGSWCRYWRCCFLSQSTQCLVAWPSGWSRSLLVEDVAFGMPTPAVSLATRGDTVQCLHGTRQGWVLAGAPLTPAPAQQNNLAPLDAPSNCFFL